MSTTCGNVDTNAFCALATTATMNLTTDASSIAVGLREAIGIELLAASTCWEVGDAAKEAAKGGVNFCRLTGIGAMRPLVHASIADDLRAINAVGQRGITSVTRLLAVKP